MSTLFDLHDRALSDYRDFVRSFILIAENTARLFSETAAASERTGAICTVLTGEWLVVWDMSFGKVRYFRHVTFTE